LVKAKQSKAKQSKAHIEELIASLRFADKPEK